jgi:hypothetical protein
MTCAIADLGLAVRYMNGEIDIPENSRGGTVVCTSAVGDSLIIPQIRPKFLHKRLEKLQQKTLKDQSNRKKTL